MRLIFASAILAISLAACAPISGAPTMSDAATDAMAGNKVALSPSGDEIFTLPRSPWPADGAVIEAAQQVSAHWQNGHSVEFQARFSLHPGTVKIVMLDNLGRRALAIDWKTGKLSIDRASWLPDALNGRRLLADVMMVYWPADMVAAALPDDLTLFDDGTARRITTPATPDQDFARIHRPAGDIWQGKAQLDNLRDGYSLQIRSTRIAS